MFCYRGIVLAGIVLLWLAATAEAQAPKAKAAFKSLHPIPKLRKSGTFPLEAKSGLKNDTELEFVGPEVGHRFLLGSYKTDGEFGYVDGRIAQTSGRNAALRLGRVQDFVLEGMIQADGVGGMFLLFGWDQGHGYVVFTPKMQKSGTVWCLCELRGGTAIAESNREISRVELRGPQLLQVAVVDRKFSLRIDDANLVRELEIERYHEGDLVLGTYDTAYGPRDLKIVTLRLKGQ